jgi:DNA-binding response OmpR family regulator
MAVRILVLEREALSMRFIRLALLEAGYSVVEAETCEEAVRLSVENNGSIQLLIADVAVGDYTAIATAQLLREVWPEIAVLFTSTVPVQYWPERDHRKAINIRGARVLVKPFHASELRQEVSMLLRPASPSIAAKPDRGAA